MKKISLLIPMFIGILSINGCKKDSPPVAQFSMGKESFKVDELIIFTNQSENASSFVWEFGDTKTSSERNPSHVYASAGTFSIKLTAAGDGGENSVTKTIVVLPSLSGLWSKRLMIDYFTAAITGTMNVVQHENNTLTGSFVFSDGTGTMPLLPSSNISGTSVTIEWMLDIYVLSFQGTVTTTYKAMSGTITMDGSPVGTWSAKKL